MKQLKVGDKVGFLHSTGFGIILNISNNLADVKDEIGFVNKYKLSDLVSRIDIPVEEIPIKDNGQYSDKKNALFSSKNIKQFPTLDLHMENLVDSHRDWTNHEIVTFQLKKLSEFLNATAKNKIQKVIIVHGVGTGKLKTEIESIVHGIPGASMFDCDYQTFGKGASFIERKYNWKNK